MSKIIAIALAGALVIAASGCATDMQKDEMMKKEEMLKKEEMIKKEQMKK